MNPFAEKRNFLRALKTKTRGKGLSDFSKANERVKCELCHLSLTKGEMERRLYVCPGCGRHNNISAKFRLNMILDKGSFREQNAWLIGGNPLNFPGYAKKIKEQREKSGLREAVITGVGQIDGIRTVVCVMDNRFIMGSMGAAVGEKITRAVEYATRKRLPLIIFSTSGGARMQEGILSLFQMAKTSAAVEKHNLNGLLYISVLTNPTTGGVTASFASLGDIILAEPEALIGFAGPRVIEQTINQTLPKGFQSAEYLKDHGFLDGIVERSLLKETLSKLLRLHERRN